jgi:hypothetical protein
MTHAIAGFISDERTEAPIDGARVEVAPGGATVKTDEFGFYRLDGLAPGEYDVSVTSPGYGTVAGRVSTETWTRLDFSLDAPGTVSRNAYFDVFGLVSDRNTVLPIEGA